ncbi:Phytoene dehydrogenase-related protein [Cohnella sp. OV330]|uniref:phytoene desaturase family protein n=1 Tax=Cohnella sp. OV330 TaxID=1855288 RepID=UPI0008F17FA8|nr:NAD(P)/FAD-dependent oxidoreductase [Cohnella sp. OV330]SFB49374.1 Phytoene dehydrogenase-related protein [Cohnella sp. OV330]
MSEIGDQKEWDVVIIGGGIAGLTASIYLARAGRSVLVLDKGAGPGGRAASNEIAESRVNMGPHALYKSALPILREVGVEPAGGTPKTSGAFVFKQAGGEYKALPLGQLLLGTFLKWHEKTQLLRFYAKLRKIDAAALQKVSLQAYLESELGSPRVRSLVLALVRVATYCNAPHLLSAGAVVEQLSQAQVMYVDGGWQSIVNRLTEQARQAGVSLLTRSPVREIGGSAPRMTVALKDGTRLSARQVISTAGPTETLGLLNPALTPAEAAQYERLTPVRAACLDLVVSGMPQPKTRFVLGADEPWYYSNHSAASALSDHPAREVVHVMKYLPVSKETDPVQDERELEGFLDLIQPGWRGHVVQRRFLPRMLVSHAVVEAESGGLSGRPGPAVEGRPGLYVAGDWVGPSGMLLNASLASAREAARCIIAGKDTVKEGMHGGA